MSERINAYQLSLLGDAPKPCKSWERPWYRWSFCGIPVPLDDDARRQNEMLRADSLAAPTAPETE